MGAKECECLGILWEAYGPIDSVLSIALARNAGGGCRTPDNVPGPIEGVAELDEPGAVRLACGRARRERAVLPQDAPRVAKVVGRGVDGAITPRAAVSRSLHADTQVARIAARRSTRPLLPSGSRSPTVRQ